jgi:hypothetical protein
MFTKHVSVVHVVCMGEEKNVHKVLAGKPERNRLLAIARRRREDNITRSSEKN